MSVYSAEAFVNSVGVGTHFSYLDTPYANWATVTTLLSNLRIRHYRDGVWPETAAGFPLEDMKAAHAGLGALGIQGNYVIADSCTDGEINAWPSEVQNCASFEGPNETDIAGGSWAATTTARMAHLYPLAQALGVPMVGPSMSESWRNAEMDVRAYVDVACLHAYYNGHFPETWPWGDDGYATTEYQISHARVQHPSAPIFVTESGYPTDSTLGYYITEAYQAKWLVRTLLHHFSMGIARTFIYELIDVPPLGLPNWSGFGLVLSDYTLKPSYTAVQSLLSLLEDRGAPNTASDLNHTLTGGDWQQRSLLFQKQDKRYFLAVWLAVETTGSQSLTLTLPALRNVTVHQWQADGTTVATNLGITRTASLTATDLLQVVELAPPPFRTGFVARR